MLDSEFNARLGDFELARTKVKHTIQPRRLPEPQAIRHQKVSIRHGAHLFGVGLLSTQPLRETLNDKCFAGSYKGSGCIDVPREKPALCGQPRLLHSFEKISTTLSADNNLQQQWNSVADDNYHVHSIFFLPGWCFSGRIIIGQ
ncbi:hypothetical protein Golax_022808 [Gossypium laxum]|uniref:Uncharacterized protein n=1 Tax=Gossypium laxum TaxID=34288 RepID=A0A7J8ZNL5_9ROSI|nr:hypothetical protein [Gossypium laxum]MBA0729654.1 hypothetical protein [Gossypium laxum]